ncbi:hypothetical protein BerOc1_01181 [Pseudodesulfovibrio hydrargyri]|uniref:Uncharacterized protein n=1 Tax=Pseudodesulfovibrio hydrargyri TaxID=2125990 RepID=A0A1J5N361_9BACT|nr:hypothetical protein [Pseudodesulfovibrio hydrargyri]OIQ49256.1 hypothetical protein BerOc1_01181 [Pseudodesulfovibrio hydrargyri]
MYLKRYLFTLVIYYLPYALLVRWVDGNGAQPGEAHAVAHTIMGLLYAVMSLNLVVFRPQARFAFESWTHRTLRWLMYLTLYIGLVLLPALLLLSHDSGMFRIILPVPALLFLGMLFSPVEKEDPDEREVKKVLADDGPRRWLTYYGLYLAVPFAGGLLIAMLVPEPFTLRALTLFSLSVVGMALWMLYRLTVARPNIRFASLTRGQRWKRFWIHAALYLALIFVLPRALEILFGHGPAMDTWLMLPLLASAAYGPDMLNAALRIRPKKPKLRPETEDERL